MQQRNTAFKNKITKNGLLIVSGFLEEQNEMLLKKYLNINFVVEKTIIENGWVCLILKYLG